MHEDYESGPMHSVTSSITGAAAGGDILQVGDVRLRSRLNNCSAEADVWLGERPNGDRVAVKIYRYGLIPGLLDAQKKRGLSHPNLLPILDAGKIEDRYYEISPFVEGPTLSRWVAQRGPLTESELAEALKQLSDAVRYLHAECVLHRDIKPSNIFVLGQKPLKVRLADFGSARVNADQTMLTATVGTIAYSAPEAVTGLQSEASDYWSLGMVLLEAVTGRPPFQGIDLRQQLYRVASGQIEIPEGLSPRLKSLFSGLLTLDYTKRWRKTEIDHWLNGKMNPARTSTPKTQEHVLPDRGMLQRLPESGKLSSADILDLIRDGIFRGLGRYFWIVFVVAVITHHGPLTLAALVVITLFGIALSIRPSSLERRKREKRVDRQLTRLSRGKRRRFRRIVRTWFREERRSGWSRFRGEAD